jgi:hypothetical protein
MKYPHNKTPQKVVCVVVMACMKHLPVLLEGRDLPRGHGH